MKTKQLAKLIRKLVKEEVKAEVNKLLTENVKPASTKVQTNNKQYTSNTELNNILNETVQSTDFRTVKSFNASDARAGFAALQSPQTNPIPDKNISGGPMDPNQVTPDIMNALTRDYTELVKRFK